MKTQLEIVIEELKKSHKTGTPEPIRQTDKIFCINPEEFATNLLSKLQVLDRKNNAICQLIPEERIAENKGDKSVPTSCIRRSCTSLYSKGYICGEGYRNEEECIKETEVRNGNARITREGRN